MASKTSAGKSGKKTKKSKESHGDFPPPVRKKISISGGKITDVEAQVVDEETELVCMNVYTCLIYAYICAL